MNDRMDKQIVAYSENRILCQDEKEQANNITQMTLKNDAKWKISNVYDSILYESHELAKLIYSNRGQSSGGREIGWEHKRGF